VLAASIVMAVMMEAARISETSVNFYPTTRRSISENRHLHVILRENLKSHEVVFLAVKVCSVAYTFFTEITSFCASLPSLVPLLTELSTG
jgi:hypothetical protein